MADFIPTGKRPMTNAPSSSSADTEETSLDSDNPSGTMAKTSGSKQVDRETGLNSYQVFTNSSELFCLRQKNQLLMCYVPMAMPNYYQPQ